MDEAVLIPPLFCCHSAWGCWVPAAPGAAGKAGDLFALLEELEMRGELIKSTVSFSLHLCVWHY